MSESTSGWLLPPGGDDPGDRIPARNIEIVDGSGNRVTSVPGGFLPRGVRPPAPDIRPAYIGEIVHLQRLDGSCWPAIVTELLEHPEGGRHIGMTVFRPASHAHNREICEAVGRTKFDDHGIPGTWHHVDTWPIHRPY